jgi:hypothetical protein
LLFKWNDDQHVTNKEGGLAGLGIGRAYEIAEPLDFFHFAEAPAWLYDKILPMPPAASQVQSIPSPHSRLWLMLGLLDIPTLPTDAALRGEYDTVVSAPRGGRNNQLNTSAFKLATLVGAGVLTEHAVESTMMQAAVTCGLVADDGHDKCLATVRSGLIAGIRSPRDIPMRESEDAYETCGRTLTTLSRSTVFVIRRLPLRLESRSLILTMSKSL